MYAPSKTFNLAGLQGSYSVCWNPAMKARVAKAAVASHYNAANVLSVHAAIGAYNGDEGAQYVDAMNAYIREEGTRDQYPWPAYPPARCYLPAVG